MRFLRTREVLEMIGVGRTTLWKIPVPAERLLCTRCGQRMHIVAFVNNAFAIRRILDHIGLSSPEAEKPPPCARSCASPSTARAGACPQIDPQTGAILRTIESNRPLFPTTLISAPSTMGMLALLLALPDHQMPRTSKPYERAANARSRS
jgi:hypothetical protein